MKKIAIFVLLVGLTSISCTENEINRESNLSVSTAKINQVLKEHDYQTQKLMYLTLSPVEKYNLWNDKLDHLIKHKELNKNQKMLLNDLKNNLFVDFFNDIENNDKAEIFKNVYIKDFLVKATKIFNSDFIHNNFFTISNNNQNKEYYGEKGCSCNIGATFTCTYKIECRSISNCRSSSNGCGFLGAFECNGRCDVLHPNT